MSSLLPLGKWLIGSAGTRIGTQKSDVQWTQRCDCWVGGRPLQQGLVRHGVRPWVFPKVEGRSDAQTIPMNQPLTCLCTALATGNYPWDEWLSRKLWRWGLGRVSGVPGNSHRQSPISLFLVRGHPPTAPKHFEGKAKLRRHWTRRECRM